MDRQKEAPLRVQRVGWFSRIPSAQQAALLAVARIRHHAAGAVLFAVGDEPGGLYGVEAGCLAIEAAQSDCPPQKGFLVHPGVWIGEGPVAGLDKRLIGAWVTRPSTVISIEVAAFRRLAARTPELWRQIALLSLESTARAIGLAQDLMLRGSRERLAALLARLGGLREAYPPDPAVVDATQTELAAIANLSRGMVSTLLAEMERDGLVRLRRAGVELVEPRRLLLNAQARAASR